MPTLSKIAKVTSLGTVIEGLGLSRMLFRGQASHLGCRPVETLRCGPARSQWSVLLALRADLN